MKAVRSLASWFVPYHSCCGGGGDGAAGSPADAGRRRRPARRHSGQVTFTKDVAPILQEKCQTCHRAGGVAPMSLLTYQQTRAYAKVIKTAGDGADDAAVVHRQDCRHPAFLRTTSR